MGLAAEVEELEPEGGRRVRRVRFLSGSEVLSFADVVAAWRRDEAFGALFLACIAEAPFEALFWETPPVTRATFGLPFEQVLVDAPALARVGAEPRAFAAHFGAATDGVAAFDNLGGDARLVAPVAPSGAVGGDEAADYAHLAAFARTAPAAQQHALLRRVAVELEARVGDRPLWTSTSGLGVTWLHVRLDAWPKYYTHRPYRRGV